jgi:hypothetical protein
MTYGISCKGQAKARTGRKSGPDDNSAGPL